MTEEKKHSIKDKEKIGIDAQFVNSEEPKEKIKNVSFPQMFRYASTYDKFLMVVGLISATGTGVLQPLNTILFGSLTGDIIAYATSIQINLPADQKKIAEDNFFDGIRYFALMNSLIGIGMFVFSYLATVTFNYSAMRQIFKIRSAYLKSILNQDVGWYDINQTGDFASRMSDDLFKFEDGIGEKVPVFWSFQVVFLTSLIIALVKGWELALICLTSLPATLITIGIVGLLTTKLAKNELEAYGAAGSIAEEALSLIRTITAFGGQKKEVDRYNKNLVEAKNNNIRRSMFSALGFGLLWFMIYASYALAFWYGVKLVLRDRTATNQIYTPSNMVTASVECTTIIVAHRLSTIRGANKIIVLSQGVVVEEGTHEELMELKQEYYRLVTAQVKSSEQFEVAEKKKVVRAISLAESSTGSDHNIEATKEDNEDDFNENKDVSVFEILKMNAPEWPYILFAGLGSIVVGCGMPVFAVLFGSILGTLANGDPDFVRSETNKYCLYFVLGGLITMVSVFTQMYLLGIAGEKMTERVRSRLFKAMIYQEIGFFDKKTNGVGALCAKLSSDASNIQGATGIRVGTILQSIATFCLAIGLSMYYEWKLGLVTAAFTPVILIAMFFERRNTRGGNDSRDSALQKSTRTAVEAVGNIRTVASLGLEEKFQQLYESELMPHYKSSLKTVHWRAIVFGLSRSLLFFAYATAMYYGGFLIRDGLPYDRVFKVSQAQIMGTVSIANSLAFSPNFAKGVAAAKKVKSFLSRIPLIRDLPSSRQMVKASGNFSFSEIEFTYPTRPNVLILKGLNLDILNGKTVALVGESGCGKSTIIQLIERFYDPRSGEVKMDGVDLKDISLDSLRSHMGIVSQEPNLFNKSIAENIAYGDNSREVSMDEIIKAAKNANIHNFITGLPKGYETKLGEKAVQLSGGQKQRIAIARALVRNPKVLLLDEATSALDTESEKVVQEALDQAKKGRTCVTIAHRLTTIQDADLICVVANGVIAESGSHQELLQKEGLYYKLYTQKT
ncbi:multidrug resistance protein 2-like isoform X2 [Diabrotica virgifera virgifera]|uniref:Uncharacterized protein n=1 Tax=Diabrotica virgifera virgifera TaxID=50390 RepID=A0ABM5KWT7_DIAVI|nr:multidrug resistance protein 2-like isoform X2 [Diabrotica virgifera virgifera]